MAVTMNIHSIFVNWYHLLVTYFPWYSSHHWSNRERHIWPTTAILLSDIPGEIKQHRNFLPDRGYCWSTLGYRGWPSLSHRHCSVVVIDRGCRSIHIESSRPFAQLEMYFSISNSIWLWLYLLILQILPRFWTHNYVQGYWERSSPPIIGGSLRRETYSHNHGKFNYQLLTIASLHFIYLPTNEWNLAEIKFQMFSASHHVK